MQMGYDAMGDITSRSDVAGGAAWTYDPVRKHAVTQAGSSSYTYAYDANGNVTSRNGSIVGWTSYNYPGGVSTATESATFDYGPNRQRWRMIYTGPSGNVTVFYSTRLFDVEYRGGPGVHHNYIYAGSRPVVEVSSTNGVVTVNSLLVDHQGSISSIITDSTGAALVGESFTAYGNRREASTWSGAPTSTELTTMNGVTREGYTFQTVLGSMGLNHMNGRVEDSVTGRFLSADPLGTIPGITQSWNRYSYVVNNPVSLVDPTGFDSGCIDSTGVGAGIHPCPNPAGDASTSPTGDPLDEIVVTAARLGNTLSVSPPPTLPTLIDITQLQPVNIDNNMNMGGPRTPLNNKGPTFGCIATINGERCGGRTSGATGGYCWDCDKKSKQQPNPDNIPPNPDPPDLGDDDNSNDQIVNPPDLRLSDSQKNSLAAGAFELFILALLAAIMNPT